MGIVGKKPGQGFEKHRVIIETAPGIVIELDTFIKIAKISSIGKEDLTVIDRFIPFFGHTFKNDLDINGDFKVTVVVIPGCTEKEPFYIIFQV